LRGEGDCCRSPPSFWRRHFYPRPPWGGRLDRLSALVYANTFLSTPSVGRATSDCFSAATSTHQFLSTPSVGRATSSIWFARCSIAISIHALRGEGDARSAPKAGGLRISIHALRG